MTDDWVRSYTLIGALFFTLIALYPIVRFLLLGWHRRRAEVFGSFTPRAKQLYINTFLQAEVADQAQAVKQFDDLYDRRYGRQTFLIPAVIFFVTVVVAVFLALYSVLVPIAAGEGTLTSAVGLSHGWPLFQLPLVATAGIAGAYAWIVSDLISKGHRLTLTPTDVMNATLRLAISAALAATVVQIAATELAMPIAFALGAFPLTTVRQMLRRFASDTLKLGVGFDDADPSKDQILSLDSIDRPTADRLMDCDVSTVVQLAYADPVQLCMRSGLNFDFICDIVSQALAWMYLGDRMNDFRSSGLRGAMEIYNLIAALDEDDEDFDPSLFALASELLKILPSLPETARNPPDPSRRMEPAQFLSACAEIVSDPCTIFLVEIWHDGDDLEAPSPDFAKVLASLKA